MEESRNYSPSPQPKYMKPEVVIIRRADLMDNAYKKQEPSEQADIAPAANHSTSVQHNNSIKSIRSMPSRRSGVLVAPSNLTKEQFDIVNLNGETPVAPSNSNYKLETDLNPKPVWFSKPELLTKPV
jgi:hypothetical protein